MKAIEIRQPGGPEVLELTDRPNPEPAAGELLVEVRAAGVNRPDCLQRQGAYPPPPGAPDIPGLEIAGEVVALGSGAGTFAVGDQVCALVPGGGYGRIVHGARDQRACNADRFQLQRSLGDPRNPFHPCGIMCSSAAG